MTSETAHPGAELSGRPAFGDRAAAGLLLGDALREKIDFPERSRVFAIPRGGLAVAAGVAKRLNAPLDIVMVRKIGHPDAPELGLGAIAEGIAGTGGAGGGEPVFDDEMLDRVGLRATDLDGVVARERAELARRVEVYRAGEPPPDLSGCLAVVVDDGLATGVTARAALRAVRTGLGGTGPHGAGTGAAWTVLAVPVASTAGIEAMKAETDEVVTLITPRQFRSVGEWYADFGQLTDDDVLTLLSPRGRAHRTP